MRSYDILRVVVVVIIISVDICLWWFSVIFHNLKSSSVSTQKSSCFEETNERANVPFEVSTNHVLFNRSVKNFVSCRKL